MKPSALFLLSLLIAGCSNTLEKQIPGTYAYQDESFDLEKNFQAAGRVDTYDANGLMEDVLETWKVVGDEMFITFPDGDNQVWRRERNGDITVIAWVTKGTREDLTLLEEQRVWQRKRNWIAYLALTVGVLALLALALWWRRSRGSLHQPSGDERI